MTSESLHVDAVRHSVTVSLSIEEAWHLFTADTGRWWPFETHSIHGVDATGIDWEPRVGGTMREVSADGGTATWADVLAWEPPHRLVLAWRVGATDRPPTEVEVRFSADGEGTRVDLEHRAWDRLGAGGRELRDDYVAGWPVVMRRFERLASHARSDQRR